MSLTLEDIRENKGRLRCEKVSAPEWSKTRDKAAHVWVRELSGAELDRAHEILSQGDDDSTEAMTKAEMHARLCVLGVCDDKQAPIFDNDSIPMLLNEQPLAPLVRCGLKVIEFNGLSDTALEDAGKNSESGQTS